MMNDLISRQSAVDALKKEQAHYSHEDGVGIFYEYNHAIEALKNLPSAQLEIIRCEDCRYANECHKSVQYTRNEPNAMTIGYSPIEWCSRGKRREECMSAGSKPIINADLIRAMTDEELAEWVQKHDCHTSLYGYDPKEAILNWLRQEVGNNG